MLTESLDGLRRRSETVGATTSFIWDGQNVLLETDYAEQTQAVYTYRRQTCGDLISQRRATVSSFHHFDALGSTTELTSASGTVTGTDRYYAFGETLASTGGTDDPFWFVGRLGYYNEPDLNLQYLRARWYQPSTARFTSRDPRRSHGLSDYVYAANRPAVLVDPSGEVPCSDCPKWPWYKRWWCRLICTPPPMHKCPVDAEDLGSPDSGACLNCQCTWHCERRESPPPQRVQCFGSKYGGFCSTCCQENGPWDVPPPPPSLEPPRSPFGP
jgi:RHS repeat-associated protein